MAVDYDKLSSTVEQAILGDGEAIQQLYSDTFPMLYNIALELMGNTHEAEDMVQEAFHLIFLNLAKIPNKRYFIPWSKRILTNYCYRTLRTKLDIPVDDFEYLLSENMEVGEDPVYTLINAEKSVHISNMLNSMDPILRRTVELKFYEDKKVQEIAEIMDCPVGTVKSRLHKARKVMKEFIEKDKPFLSMMTPVLPLSMVLKKTTAHASSGVSTSISSSAASVGASSSISHGGLMMVATTTTLSLGSLMAINMIEAQEMPSTSFPSVESQTDSKDSFMGNIEFLNSIIDEQKVTLLVGELVSSDSSNNNSLDSNQSDDNLYHVANVDFDSIYGETESGEIITPSTIDTSNGVVVFDKIEEAITVYVSDYNGYSIKSRVFLDL